MKTEKILLDLFCKAGGMSMGYWMALARSGWRIIGVDKEPQPNYPFEFHQGDALEVPLDGFDAIHASPPCQGYSSLRHRNGRAYPRLISAVRERVLTEAPGAPYVIEKVEQARPEMIDLITLCGSSFGLRVRRHRLFETNFPVDRVPCDHVWQDGHRPYRIYVGKSRTNGLGYRESGIQPVHGGNHNIGGNSVFLKSVAMGIDWMTEEELNEAIPPAYSHHIGRALLKAVQGGPAIPASCSTPGNTAVRNQEEGGGGE